MNNEVETTDNELAAIGSPFILLETPETKPTIAIGSHAEAFSSSDPIAACSPASSTDGSNGTITPHPHIAGSNASPTDKCPYEDFYNSDQCDTSFNNNKLSDEDLKTAKYVNSFRGNRLVACKDYIYRRKMARAGKTYWSCINNNCTAKLHVTTGSDPPEVLNQQGDHSHLAEYGATIAREALNMYVSTKEMYYCTFRIYK